jgi:thiol-disulfide isomerase/thioredoxin
MQTINLLLSTYQPISGDYVKLYTRVDSTGHFYFDVPTETKISIAGLWFDDYEVFPLYTIISGEETHVKININKEGQVTSSETNSHPFNAYDISESYALFVKMDQYSTDDSRYNEFRERSDLTPEEYIRLIDETLNYRIENVVTKDSILSPLAKQYLSDEFLLGRITTLFFYPENMEDNFRHTNPKEKWDSFVKPQIPDKKYYSFLKDLQLNDPKYLYCDEYYNLMNVILRDETIHLPPIKDTPIQEWLAEVKSILSDLLGFSEGQFYDLLVTSAYNWQFESETKSLSDKQIENIKSYFKKNDIAAILLKKNEKIKAIETPEKGPVVNETPAVPLAELQTVRKNEQSKSEPIDTQGMLVDSIIANYKGQVVVVDFWATWCAPCLEAMQKIRELKKEMLNRDVLFVYITNSSSPAKGWEERIQGISGEHYYLNGEEWESISFSDKYGFNGIPTYLIFDKNGELKHKITAYPGNSEMRKMIEDLLTITKF